MVDLGRVDSIADVARLARALRHPGSTAMCVGSTMCCVCAARRSRDLWLISARQYDTAMSDSSCTREVARGCLRSFVAGVPGHASHDALAEALDQGSVAWRSQAGSAVLFGIKLVVLA